MQENDLMQDLDNYYTFVFYFSNFQSYLYHLLSSTFSGFNLLPFC